MSALSVSMVSLFAEHVGSSPRLYSLTNVAHHYKQEAQLMLTNLRDAFGGQSRSRNIVPFHMLGIVSYCAIVTLSLRYSTSKNVVTLKLGVKGHSRSLRVVSFDRLCMVPISVLY